MEKRCKEALRLNKLLKHVKDKDPRSIQAKGRSLLAIGFTRTHVADGRNHPEFLAVDDDGPAAPDIASADVAHGTPELFAGVDARNTLALGSRVHVTEVLAATDQTGVVMGQLLIS